MRIKWVKVGNDNNGLGKWWSSILFWFLREPLCAFVLACPSMNHSPFLPWIHFSLCWMAPRPFGAFLKGFGARDSARRKKILGSCSPPPTPPKSHKTFTKFSLNFAQFLLNFAEFLPNFNTFFLEFFPEKKYFFFKGPLNSANPDIRPLNCHHLLL